MNHDGTTNAQGCDYSPSHTSWLRAFIYDVVVLTPR
jgi:hypothetical protein